MTLTDEELTKIINENKDAFTGISDKLTKSKVLEEILEKKYNVQGKYRIESTKAMSLVKPMSSSAEKGMTNLNYVQTGSVNENVKTFFKELGYGTNVRGSVVTDDAINLYMHEAGDVKVKKFLNRVMQAELEPIRERRKVWEKRIPEVYEILEQGSKKAQSVAAETLADMKRAMKINYFEDRELIEKQAASYAEESGNK